MKLRLNWNNKRRSNLHINWIFIIEFETNKPLAAQFTGKKDSFTLRWRHNERDGVSNHQPHDCLLNRLFRRRSKKISKLRVTGLCDGNSPGTGEFPAQMASNAENISIWWRYHECKFKHSHASQWYNIACGIDSLRHVKYQCDYIKFRIALSYQVNLKWFRWMRMQTKPRERSFLQISC